MSAENIYAKRLMQKGVKGFLSKQSSIEELENAIRCLLKGEIYLSGSLKDAIFRANKPDAMANPIDLLSDRELEVIELLKKGHSSKEIAELLHLSVKTVEVHRYNILRKLKLKNTAALVDYIHRRQV